VSVDMKEHLRDISDGLKYNDTETIVQSLEEVLPLLEDVMELLKEYDNSEHAEDPTYTFWCQYMELVGILLRFTRAIQDGNWHLYKSSFSEMLPWFAALDRVNYMRWKIVYLADMQQLEDTAPEVFQEFLKGDFVVKETNSKFVNIPDDMGIEHVNRMGKVAGGLIGISRSDYARNRWGLTYMIRSQLAEDTKTMLGVNHNSDSDSTHKDTGMFYGNILIGLHPNYN